jgi:DNA-binding LacI/PurR family transcriptional regulator
MRTTLQDIASDTGLSVSTVSRILSRKSLSNSENEKSVLSSARKLNYPYILNNHVNNGNHINRIALITEIFEGEFYSSLFYWFYQASLESNCEFSQIESTHQKILSPEFIVSIRKNYDAICILFSEMTESDYETLMEMLGNIPAVSLAPILNPYIDTVTFDSYRGGHLAAKHFEDLGYNKVGLIAGPSTKVEALYRKNGFLDHVAASKKMECVWTFKGDYSIEAGKQAYNDLKNKNLENIAVFGSNDQTCFGFMKSVFEDGKSIPHDYAICGYDDLPLCKNLFPELTSIHTDFFELGKATMRLLEKKLQGQNDSNGHVSLIPVTINKRTSTLGKVMSAVTV